MYVLKTARGQISQWMLRVEWKPANFQPIENQQTQKKNSIVSSLPHRNGQHKSITSLIRSKIIEVAK